MSTEHEPYLVITEVPAPDGGSALWAHAPDGEWHNQGGSIRYATLDDLIRDYGRVQVVELTDRFIG